MVLRDEVCLGELPAHLGGKVGRCLEGAVDDKVGGAGEG